MSLSFLLTCNPTLNVTRNVPTIARLRNEGTKGIRSGAAGTTPASARGAAWAPVSLLWGLGGAFHEEEWERSGGCMSISQEIYTLFALLQSAPLGDARRSVHALPNNN